MKKLLLLAAATLLAVGAQAQGLVNFANIGGGTAGSVNAPVRDITVLASGAAYAAQLYWGAAGTTDSSTLTINGVSGSPATFGTAAQAGYFTGGSRIITGASGGTTVTLQVRAWATATGSSWDTATIRGESNLIQYTLATSPATPNNMVGLQAFNVAPVPEPSAIALGLLGLGAVALIRRRK
jgi:MYXO-CTERM domain-containing protein